MATAYYNECDRQKAAVIRELVKCNVIAPGDVDERSIVDVRADDIRGYTQCHFFAGIGAWSYALRIAGWPDDRPVWTGSCPCPSFSSAGKGRGFTDPRHLWPDWYRLVRKCKPATVFGEQVAAAIRHGWLDLVQSQMEAEGYAVGKAVLTSASVGGADIRERLYFVAHAKDDRRERSGGARQRRHGLQDGGATGFMGHADQSRSQGQRELSGAGGSECTAGSPGPLGGFWTDAEWIPCRNPKVPGAVDWRPIKPGTFVLANGVAGRVLGLRAAGDAINVQVAKTFIKCFMETEEPWP